MRDRNCSRKEWENHLRHDCVLVTMEFGDRVVRRLLSKTELFVVRDPAAFIGRVLHDPIMDVLDGGGDENAR